ncbi:MAG: hypothetical protein ACE5GK_11155 [Nitrospiria bacterium]
MKTNLKPKFVTDEKGKKTSVILNIKDYNNLLEYLEDLEDAYDLLKAEHEASGFIPYEAFREKFLAGKTA